MERDKADLVLCQTAILDRQAHGARRLLAVGIEAHDMVRITGRGVT